MTTELPEPVCGDSVMDVVPRSLAVTVYTTGSSCMQCALTEKVLTDLGIPFTELDITLAQNRAARAYVVDDLGYTHAPVVVVDGQDHWSGFQLDQIRRIAIRLAARHSG